MKMSYFFLHSTKILLPLLLYLSMASFPLSVSSENPVSEQAVLLKIKQEWGNQPSMQLWTSTNSPCLWPGINCTDGETITGISLNSQNIDGEIPSSICDLNNLTLLDLGNNNIEGKFPTFLYNCTKLKTLVLGSNYFVGLLPSDIDNLSPNLEHLDLSQNNFTGSIPASLARLERLITLQLDSNLFNGTFPSELGRLESLEELVLTNNPFTPMKIPNEFGMLKRLRFLWMQKCNLIGEIPSNFADFKSLEHLDLVENNLVGEIPSGLFLLTNLTYLYLHKNRLSGGIPASINTVNLKELDLSTNNLTGEIPEGIGNLRKLEILYLFQNQFYGTVPSSIGLLPSLMRLKLFSNNFSGSLPSEMGRHSKLQGFEVADNAFTGKLPENLCFNRNLLGVVAFNNFLNGTIPSSLGQCNSLLVVLLSNNSFSGEIPEGLWSLQHVQSISLSSNQFSGQIPEHLGWNLSRVEISNNKFSGKIPSNVSTWTNLQVLTARNNMITGTVPLELTSLTRLNTLLLDGNQLTGMLPSEIISWQNLNNLNLSHNNLFGSIPSVFGSLPVLNYLDLSDNHFSGQIPPELGNLELNSLNLSSNMLTGKIPYGLDNSVFNTSFLNTNLCSDDTLLNLPKCSIVHQKYPKKLSSKYIALIIVLTVVAFLAVLYFMVAIITEIRQRKHKQEPDTWKLTSFHRLHFTEKKILNNLTENNVIGFGGSCRVYRIPVNQSGDVVAVKRIWNSRNKSNSYEKEFNAEVQILGTIRHLNIVKLLCCISTESSKLLVYEYMEKQSLDKWIHGSKRRAMSSISGSVHHVVLDWPTRLKIAIDAAQGLSYMHNDCSPPIIHRDVKSSNILLDSKFNAKIADFGLAKILDEPGESHTVSVVAGSFGYMAPEYSCTTKVNEKIDIYSFGVVLLELVTGKEPHIGDEHTSLAEWAWKHYSKGNLTENVLDKEIQESSYLEEMNHVLKIGLMCTSTLPSSRPSMKEVVQMLQQCSNLEDSDRAKAKIERGIVPLLGGVNSMSGSLV